MPESPIKSVAFVSLGCPKNLIDSEAMLGTLVEADVNLVSDHDAADAIIINTCGFLEDSKEESLEVIAEAIERKEKGSVKRVVVAGCLVQRHRAKLLEWAPGIDAMIGVFDRDHILDAVHGSPADRTSLQSDETPPYWIEANALQAARTRGLNTVGLTVNGQDGHGIGYFESDARRLRLTPKHWAYLRISEGCNQKCTFCTIPSIRGKMRSKPPQVILSEARSLLEDGVFELNLIGQDTTSYGHDIGYHSESKHEGLVGLLTSLNEVVESHGTGVNSGGGSGGNSGGGWIRLMYAYPTDFTDAMIDAIASLPHVANYIDIPLQHMTDSMLSAMRRRTSREEQWHLLEKLRDRIPGVAIRTTFITGFPGETEKDHEDLLDFIRGFQFDALGVFRYSPEPGTPAATLDQDPNLHVPDDLKLVREQEIMLAQQEIAFDNAQYVAEQRSQFDILIDQPAEQANAYFGRGYHQAPQVDSQTLVHSTQPLKPGDLVRCTIVDADGYDLIARPSGELEPESSLPTMRESE